MFSVLIRTNRQSSHNIFYFLHTLFILYACTASFTTVSALNNHENEAFIQLSVDSIHVVKPSDPRFANIEENSNDDEEKELLIALLTSFDDDHTNVKQNDIGKLSEFTYDNKIFISNNCTSSSSSSLSVAATASESSSSSSIRFIPPLLDFGEQSIAIPRIQTVMIINDDSEPLELQSLSGTTVQFYSSFFTQKILPPKGGNTSISVYYLPRTLGSTKSTFTIKTNLRTVHYYVTGIGTSNPFLIRPLIGATIPLNSTFEYIINFYNPYNYSLHINEIFTSDENLIIELLSYKTQKTKIIKSFEHIEHWHLKPYEKKPLVKINYLAYKLDRLHGFYCIKTNSNDTIIVPVEINVVNHLNIYSNVDLLELSSDGFIRSTARPITVPVYVINNGITPVTITNVRVTVANMNYATVNHEKVQVPTGIYHLTKIAELTIHPHLIPRDMTRLRGSVEVYSSSSSSSSLNDEEPALRIPFRATVLHGSLDYDKEATYFYIPSLSTDESYDKIEQCRPIKLINRFNTSMVMYNATTDATGLLLQYMNIKFYSPYVYVRPGESVFPVCLNILKQTVSTASLITLEASIILHTNLSFFHMPIHLYRGLLNIDLTADNSSSGIRRNDVNPSEYYIASIPVNSSRTVKFILKNTNPIDIPIEKISLTLPKTNIRLIQLQLLNGSETKVSFKSLYQNEDITELVIPARHQAVLALTIHGTSDPSFYDETLSFKTPYQNLDMNVKYRIVSASIELENKLPLHIDAFPNRIGMVDVVLNNGFDELTEILRVEFLSYGQSFSFYWNNTSFGKLIIQPNQTYLIGKLTFDMRPLCNSIVVPSESTCYCGLNNHPEYKQKWKQHTTALNNYEVDHILVSKFRSLWQDWTSLVRKQRIQTNIWLVTDQANMSWPVTIGFVWPSVLELMSPTVSRTPIILDFHLTHINTAKTQNIIITNPSSNIVQYSIELIGNYENTRNNNKKIAVNNNNIFIIATTFKGVELLNGIYKFSLQPDENIIFTASYRPKLTRKHEIYLVVRNNLTIMESILLRGEGGKGSLTVGNRKAGSSDIPLVLEMNEKQYKLCSDYLSTGGTSGNPVLQKIVTLRNTGNMKAVIHSISFGDAKCSGQGFSVNTCSNIEIEPNERYDLRIRFQPDYTLAEIAESLTLFTNIGSMTFPLIVRIPQRVLATCYQTIPRPVWESQMHCFCLCAISVLILCIFTMAVYEARRLFDDYLARAELRSRLSATNPKLFEFTDITAAVQDEHKIRERKESRASTSSINTKKDVPKDEIKTKDNDTKTKRSNSSVSGNKDIIEAVVKTLQKSDGPNIASRPTSTSSKSLPQKPKRSITDSYPGKSSKQQTEVSTKPNQLKAQRSNHTEQSTVVTSSPSIPPSTNSATTVTDEETEPFVIPRPKRYLSKTKEVTTSIIPVKSASITDGIVPVQPTPSLPHISPPSSSTVIEKSSTRLDLSEQRKDQQNLSRSTDSLNDQQWHRVSSSRGLRKAATTNRREATDESQTANKTNKITSNNTENPVAVSSSATRNTYASISSQMSQSRRRRGRHLTRGTTSSTHVSNLTKRQSLQTNTPFSVHNRELAFRQLAEQLWAAGLPSSATASSLSIRSRCSSAPPSERGGDDDMTIVTWNNHCNDEQENMIDWDEPDKPDDDFSRYVSQVELCVDEPNDNNEWTKPPSPSPTTNDKPSFISITTTATPPPSSIIEGNISPNVTISTIAIEDNVDSIPFVQHGPGPIQRPTRPTNLPTQQSRSSPYFINSIQSPETPDVIGQIYRFLDHQNSATPTVSSTPNANDSSVPINDLATPNMAWTTFLPSTWASKYESSWPSTSIQSPAASLTTQVQNPFALMTSLNNQPQQSTREDSSVWSAIGGASTPRSMSSSLRTQRISEWNEFFSATVPSSTESTKSTNSSWLKFWSAPDPSTSDGVSSNGHEIEPNNAFWSLGTLTNEPVIPSTATNQQQRSPSTWWPNNASSDENNNNSQINHLNDDTINNRDRSRWDFAR
ncbi:unnamed protein product [Rotaria socialis]|uniref:Transmembrane protein n=1 Tax=Rotaria socialis TaxID=392032 RepID=A0A820SP06_9BILA|nr:unnamed protein product [Rotaria socialis]